MKTLIILVFFFLLSSCNKTDPTPETSDEIYKDLLEEFEVASKGLESEQKNLQKLQQERDSAVPQTGQVKFANQKVNETLATVNKLQQQKQFFEIKIELRKSEARRKYLESKKLGKPWPDPVEIANYKASMKLQRDKLNWEKNKGMKKDVPRGTKEHGAEPAKAEHGGGGH